MGDGIGVMGREYVRLNDKSVYTDGQMQAGTVRINGRLSTGEYLQLDEIATDGGGCAPNGLVGRTHEGTLLSCHAGIWTKNGTTIRSFEAYGKEANWGKCVNNCPPGYARPHSGGQRLIDCRTARSRGGNI